MRMRDRLYPAVMIWSFPASTKSLSRTWAGESVLILGGIGPCSDTSYLGVGKDETTLSRERKSFWEFSTLIAMFNRLRVSESLQTTL